VSERRGFLDTPAEAPPPPPLAPPILAEPNVAPERGWLAAEGPAGPVRPGAVEALPGAAAGPRSPLLAAAGAVLGLVAVTAILQTGNFVAAQFDRTAWLGWLSLLLLLPLGGLLVASVAREWRGYAQLDDVEGLRRRLAAEDPATVREAAGAWLAATGASAELRRVVAGAADAATVRALLRSGPLAEAERATSQAGRNAALQVVAATAVIPWPGLDGVVVAWRGMRLVRQVAAIHGLRPGTLGTWRLFQRVALDAGTVAAADIAAAAVTEALFSSPALGGLAGQATAAAVAARRMIRLSHAVAEVCRPL
jgi:putative membrane protein